MNSDTIDVQTLKVGVQLRRFKVRTPAVIEPEWAGSVARWHQLDDATFALVEAAFRFRRDFPDDWISMQPRAIWLATPGGSNLADAEFVSKGCRSPSRFVGTLPSIRSSSLTLLMNWRGPVLCLQAGAETTATGLSELFWYLSADGAEGAGVQAKGPVWLVSARQQEVDGGHEFDVAFFSCGSETDAEYFLTTHAMTNPHIETDVLSWTAENAGKGGIYSSIYISPDTRLERSAQSVWNKGV